MGIPVGWNMRRDEAKEKDVLRSDVSGTRSPIRRRARGSRPRNPPLNAFDMDALAGAPTPRLAHIEHAARLSHTRTQLPPAPPVPALREAEGEGEGEGRRLGEGRPLDGPADEWPLATLTPGFAPAARSRRPLYEEAMASLRRRARAEHAAPTPSMQRPSPPSLARERRIALADLADGPPPPPIPYDYVLDGDTQWPMRRRHTRYATAPNDDTPNGDTSNTEPTAVSLPPLRRVGHRRIADGPLPASSLHESSSPVSTLDGLGDRERSNSVSSTSSHLPWTTFLSTVVPDPVAPTAESSFASAAASASFTASSRASSSNSAASSATHLTVPSRHASPPPSESFMRACESSDEDTASDTEDEAAANVLSRRRIRPSYFADEPPSPERYGRRVMQTSRNASAYVRSFYDARTADEQLDGPVDDSAAASHRLRRRATRTSGLDGPEDARRSSASVEPPMDQELRDARSLLERLARRDDVSDDFWASVGLTRSFADGVERVQDRGRF